MDWGMGIFDRFRTDCVYWWQCIVYGIELRALPSSTTPMPCLSVCYRNEMDLDQVPSLWWNNLCRGDVRSEPGGVDHYSSYCSVFQASSLKAVFRFTRGRAVSNTSRSLLYVVELSYFINWNLTLYILTEETVYCFCGNKPVHDCCCFESFYRLALDFLALLIHDWYWNSIMDEYDFL